LQLILRPAIQNFLFFLDVCSHAAGWVFMRQLSQEFDSKVCCSKVLGAELKEESFGILEYIFKIEFSYTIRTRSELHNSIVLIPSLSQLTPDSTTFVT
jgi:hypothetical protein